MEVEILVNFFSHYHIPIIVVKFSFILKSGVLWSKIINQQIGDLLILYLSKETYLVVAEC